MTVVLKDRIKQYTSTAGSGDLSFTTTPNGYAPFSSVFNSGDLTYYCIENGSAWEVGIGRYLQNSLSREAVFSSSTGSKLNLAGRSIVFVTLPASGIVRFDDLNESNLSLSQLSNVLNTALNSGDVLTYNGSSWENKSFSSSYSNEQAQDAVGSIFADTSSISLSYDDNTPLIYAGVRNSGIVNSMISSGIDSAKIGFGIVDNIEFGYLDGVTSSIQSQLNSKAASGHLHTSADITDFSESVDDRVSSLLNAGTGIQLTYNDSGNSLSIDAYGILPTGGSAGQILSKINALNYNTEWIDNYAKEIVQYVKNSTGSTLYKGQVVYINGADGTNPTISLSIASGEPTSSKTLGFLKQDLNQGEFGDVVTEGLLDGLNTNAALNDGDPIWLSPTTPGGVVYGLANKPYAPNHLVFLGYVIRKNINNGRIYVKVQNGFELYELHNVSATGAINGDILRYNSTNSLWESQAPPLYTDENAQDAVGGILTNTTSISLSYDDNANSISAIAIESGIDHNLLKNRIINEHINHTGVLINAGTGLTGGGDISSSLTLNLADTTISSGVYGSNNQVASFTVDAQGRLISASNIAITPANIGAIGSLNGLTATTQTFAVANTGTDFDIVSSGTAHEFRIPNASETARGVVSTGTQRFAGIKYFNTSDIRLGTGSNDQRISLFGTDLYVDNNLNGSILFRCNSLSQNHLTVSATSPNVRSLAGFSIATNTVLEAGGNDVLESRRGTNAQSYRVYNTYTDTSNYERGVFNWSSNILRIGTEQAGTGGSRAFNFIQGGTFVGGVAASEYAGIGSASGYAGARAAWVGNACTVAYYGSAIGWSAAGSVGFATGVGAFAYSDIPGRTAMSGGQQPVHGQFRRSGTQGVSAYTADAVATLLSVPSSGTARAGISLVANNSICLRGIVLGLRDTNTETAAWFVDLLVQNNNGTLTLIYSNFQQQSNNSNAWSVAVSLNQTAKTIDLMVTGEAGKNIIWDGFFMCSQLAY